MDFPPKQPIHRGWSAPPPGSFKVNVDGATSTRGAGNSGVVWSFEMRKEGL